MKYPKGIAVSSRDGTVYISDQNTDSIKKFTSDGVFIIEWGTFGNANGKFRNPEGIAVSPLDGSVYVTETGNNDRIQKFSVGP